MSTRLAWVVCCALVVIPRAADASAPPEYQRPPEYRHAINAVIGDASFLQTYGALPSSCTDADLRVRTHLEHVHELLGARDIATLPAALQLARARNLENLREYIRAGCFPRNGLFPDQNRPCFIDHDGRICAVGYLIEQSAGRELAARINAQFQSEFLWRMDSEELARWVAGSGLTLLELSMIQPTYEPKFYVTVTSSHPTAPADVRIVGRIGDSGSCGVEYAEVDWGDGSEPWHRLGFFWWMDIDLTHTYTCPGEYTITGKLLAESQYCGWAQPGIKTWIVSFAAPAFAPVPVVSEEGPPFLAYLRTASDIRYSYLRSHVIDWGDGDGTEFAGWYFEESGYRTAAHWYDATGIRNITVTNGYAGDACSFEQTATVVANIGNATAVESSTWGRVKALYR